MISAYWLQKRQRHWERLEQLLDQGRKQGLKSLTRAELQEMGLLYRQAAADLSALREDASGKAYARSLNILLARAHNTIYSGHKSRGWGIFHFYRDTYPKVFRRNLHMITAAFLLFMAGALAGAVMAATSPQFVHAFLGPRMMESIEQHKMWTDSVVSVMPLASSQIMTNNLSVSFVSFAGGITAGIFTTYSMVFNGLLLGVVGVACWMAGMSLPLWSFVAPHGILELPAIFIAGGGGLRIAQGLLFPGWLPRKDSLVRAAAEAVKLLMGILPMLVIVGLLEGFFSPAPFPPALKFIVSGVLGTVFFSYLIFCGRGKEANGG